MEFQKEKDFIADRVRKAFETYALGAQLQVRQKASFDLVTDVDVAIERYLTDAICREFPGDRIHGEEMSGDQQITGRTWTIDPIDGTCNLARSIPTYGVQCALFSDGEPVVSVIYLHHWQELYTAVRGGGSWCNGERICVNGQTQLQNAIISFGDYTHKSDALALRQHRAVGYVYPRVGKLRMYGAACIDFALLASGRTDATALITKNLWDLAPGVLLCREAGAIVQDLEGQPYSFGATGVVACASVELAQLMKAGFAQQAEESVVELKHIAYRSGRLSSFLREEMGMSAGLMNRLKWKDGIFVNGQPQHTDYPVMPGDVITVPLDEPKPEYPAEDGPLAVLFEDAHILAVDKPAGMLIHPSRSRLTGTLANRVVGYYERTGQACAFHPITRLDRDTFGIVLLAKNSHVHRLLGSLQEQGALHKTYHALVWGGPEADAGIIDAPIARLPLPSLLRQVHPEGKPSVTEFEVLERREACTKLALRPITGRTHQLRVHCAHMGYPILGDPQYGSEASLTLSRTMSLQGQHLCAKTLEFTHPITGQPICLSSGMDV